MPEYDICIIHEEKKGGGWFSSLSYRRIATEFLATGKMEVIFIGDWHTSKYQSVPTITDEQLQAMKEKERTVSSLIADGWIRFGKKVDPFAYGDMFYRESTSPSSEIIPLSERLKIVNGFIQNEQHRSISDYLLKALEKLRKMANSKDANDLVELLERISKLHKDGDLSDFEFEQAKRKVLGK